MRKDLLALMCAGILGAAAAARAAEPAVPSIDRPKIESYIRYAEAYTAAVKFTIDDPAPSPFPGFYRLLVHLSVGGQPRTDRLYYVSADGKIMIPGAMFDLNEHPFIDAVEHLTLDGPSFGPDDAKVTIAVFSDFECPFCREFAKTLRDNVAQKYPHDVRVVFKNFPIDSIHKWARAAAEDARCLSDQSAPAFWAFHDWIFEHQQEVNDAYEHQRDQFGAYLRDKILDAAKQQNVDQAKLTSCIDTHATAQQVQQSVEEARTLQVQQTPTLFVNGRMVGGAVPWPTLEALIQLELNRPKDIPAPPAAGTKCCGVELPTIVKK